MKQDTKSTVVAVTVTVALMALVAAVMAVGISLVPDAAGAGGREKVTLCHAAGLDGTTKSVTITVAYPAAFGPAGHFHEDGTPRAGHEDDYLGACEETPVTTVPPTTEPPVTTVPPTTEQPTPTIRPLPEVPEVVITETPATATALPLSEPAEAIVADPSFTG